MNKFLFIIAGLIVVAGLTVGAPKIISTIRGIRNNNPLNIEKGQDWQGEGDSNLDSRFEVYSDVVFGIRAGAKILMSYAGRGVNTVEKIISTWAPPIVNGKKENDTEAYINFVCKKTGFDRKKTISKNAGDYVPLLKAMITMECGVNPYSDETIKKGVALA